MNENTQTIETNSNSHQEATHENEAARQQLRATLPQQMLVAIDGRAQSGKNTVGALVAEEIDAVLVDSGRFYRALTMACIATGVNLDVQTEVTRFCCSALIEVRFCKESGPVPEAQVAVNGRWFPKEELNLLGVEVCEVSKLELVRARINETLRFCADDGRVVMLGRDIAAKVFPATQFAFFLDAPKQVRERRQQSSRGWTDATARDQRDAHCISIRRGTTVIDTSKNSLRKSVIAILRTLLAEAKKSKPGKN